MTFGAGGHSKAILNKNPNSVLYALDRDPLAYDLAKKVSREYRQVKNSKIDVFYDIKLRVSI